MNEKNNKKMLISFLLCTAIICNILLLVACNRDKVVTGTEMTTEVTTEVTSEEATMNSTTIVEPTDTDASGLNEDGKGDDAIIANVNYKNTEYGFSFALPDSWKDYTIIKDTWQGKLVSDTDTKKEDESGPIISIRHPEWTKDNPRQDIPVMVFTYSQWELVEKEDLILGAAPIGPSELGRNSVYVFALPARYNFAFNTGYEEVEQIITDNSFLVNENISKK